MQHHGEDNSVDEHHVVPQEESEEGFTRGQGVHGIQHLNNHQDGQRDRRGRLGHVVGEHLAADLRELGGTLVEVRQLPEGDLGAFGVVQEPPCIAEDGGRADVRADHHVAEEEPAADERLVALARGASHHVVVGRVEGQGGCRQSVGDQVHPQELHGDQGFGHTQGGGQEDRHDLTDVRGDQVPDELLRVAVD